MDERAEEDVLGAYRRGDKAAYATLAERHYRHIFALCLGMLANVHDAEDVAQETLLKGFQNVRGLARPERFEPWILRIAKNLCVDWLRRRKRTRRLPVEQEAVVSYDQGNHDLEGALRRLPQSMRA